ncbi:hypothetical protein [Desulfosporosinus lacus]|nr:hypothetical protein [Desulfosporosinus lacus]
MKKAAGLETVDKGIYQQFFLYVDAAEINLGRVEPLMLRNGSLLHYGT